MVGYMRLLKIPLKLSLEEMAQMPERRELNGLVIEFAGMESGPVIIMVVLVSPAVVYYLLDNNPGLDHFALKLLTLHLTADMGVIRLIFLCGTSLFRRSR